MEWTQKELAGLLTANMHEQYKDFSVLGFENFAVAKGWSKYQVHVRPAAFLVKTFALREYGKILEIKSNDSDWQRIDSPLSLLTLGIDKGDPVMLRISGPDAFLKLKRSVDDFESYLETEEYVGILEEKKQSLHNFNENLKHKYKTIAGDNAEEKLRRLKSDYESQNQEYAVLKLLLENFILKNILRIEERVRSHVAAAAIDWNSIDDVLRQVLFETGLGIHSMENAYDNLLQLREMCYDQHSRQVAMRMRLSHRQCELDWSVNHTGPWRNMQDLRILYFFDRESIFYRDLFLMLLAREPLRIKNFLTQWGPRLQYSLLLRSNLDSELQKIKAELLNFSPNFDDPKDFLGRIENACHIIKESVSEYTGYFRMIADKRIYLVQPS